MSVVNDLISAPELNDQTTKVKDSYPHLLTPAYQSPQLKLITKPFYKNPSQSFPCWRFQVLLTLFSEFFASFPRGTCLLSVSHQIFSLRWSLPPALGCTLKQPDSEEWKHVLMKTISQSFTGLSPSMVLCSKRLWLRHSIRDATLIDYNSDVDVTHTRF